MVVVPWVQVRRVLVRMLDVIALALVVLLVYRLWIVPRDFAAFPARPAPAVRLASLAGPPFDLARLRGRVVFLDFWASWCEPCRASMPLVRQFARAHPDAVVVSIDAGESPRVAAAFARAHGMTDVAFDPQMKATDAFAVEGFPTIVVVDPRGVERAKWFGFNPAIESLMGDALATFAPRRTTSWIAPAEAAASADARPLTLAIDGDPNTLDPLLDTPYGWQLAPLTQGYLFTVDGRGRLVPDLAVRLPTRANGGISADGKTIRYDLRAARWSDGAPFDARDVAFTVRALLNPRTSVPDRSTAREIASVDVAGPRTLLVRLKAPDAGFVASFLTLGANDPFAILPRHVVAQLASLDRSPLDANPVGLGPYRLVSWERGAGLRFARNPYYWRGPAGVPEIRVAIVPDPATRLTELRAGDLDVVYLSGLLVDQARTIPGARVVEQTTNIVDYLQMNLRSPALRPLAVRRALAAALDRRKLARAVYHGLEAVTDSDQLDPQFRARARLPPYDPAAARRALAGRRLRLDFAVAGTWRSSDAAAIQIADDLGRAGVETTIRSYATSVFWGPRSAGGILDAGRYDIALTSWSPSLDPDRAYLFGCAARPPEGANSMDYCDPAFDRLERAARATLDPQRRAAAYRAAGDVLVRDLPVIPLGFERSAYVVGARLANFTPNVLGRDYWNAWAWKLRDRPTITPR